MRQENLSMVRSAFQDNDMRPAKIEDGFRLKYGYPRFLLRLTQGAEAHVRHRDEVLERSRA